MSAKYPFDVICELMLAREMSESKSISYWHQELESLGIRVKKTSELNDAEELQALADNLKQTYFQDFETAHNESRNDCVDRFHFGHLI